MKSSGYQEELLSAWKEACQRSREATKCHGLYTESKMSGKVLLTSVVVVGLLSLSSCRSLGELSEQKTYSATPSSPADGSGGGYESTPTPTYGTTPSTPSAPSHDVPQAPTKHEFIGSCDYWKSHRDAIVAAIGSLGSIGETFGAACSTITGKKLGNLHDALSNPRTDGAGALLREGAAAYLNSIVSEGFPFTTQQVKGCVVVAMASDGAASAQAGIFKKANDLPYKY
ncbi:hypothetical protein ABZP36_032925 [Zizania latifolia]